MLSLLWQQVVFRPEQKPARLQTGSEARTATCIASSSWRLENRRNPYPATVWGLGFRLEKRRNPYPGRELEGFDGTLEGLRSRFQFSSGSAVLMLFWVPHVDV